MTNAKLIIDDYAVLSVDFDPANIDYNDYFVYATVYQDRETLEVLGAHYDLGRQPHGLFGEEFVGGPVETERTCEVYVGYYGSYDVPVTFRTCWAIVDRNEWLEF